ncbi:MAG: hypothetical protein ACXABY_24430 [Candidatus Thorarchaeota archaeon]
MIEEPDERPEPVLYLESTDLLRGINSRSRLPNLHLILGVHNPYSSESIEWAERDSFNLGPFEIGFIDAKYEFSDHSVAGLSAGFGRGFRGEVAISHRFYQIPFREDE